MLRRAVNPNGMWKTESRRFTNGCGWEKEKVSCMKLTEEQKVFCFERWYSFALSSQSMRGISYI